MLVRGGGAYEKSAAGAAFSVLLFLRACCVAPYPLNLWISHDPVVCAQVTPAAAERPERQRPSERGGVISPEPPFSPVRPAAAFSPVT